jgi:hypothetical protein
MCYCIKYVSHLGHCRWYALLGELLNSVCSLFNLAAATAMYASNITMQFDWRVRAIGTPATQFLSSLSLSVCLSLSPSLPPSLSLSNLQPISRIMSTISSFVKGGLLTLNTSHPKKNDPPFPYGPTYMRQSVYSSLRAKTPSFSSIHSSWCIIYGFVYRLQRYIAKKNTFI